MPECLPQGACHHQHIDRLLGRGFRAPDRVPPRSVAERRLLPGHQFEIGKRRSATSPRGNGYPGLESPGYFQASLRDGGKPGYFQASFRDGGKPGYFQASFRDGGKPGYFQASLRDGGEPGYFQASLRDGGERVVTEDAEAPLHLLPGGTSPGPVELSIVIPALNEEVTIGEFVAWCREGLEKAGVAGQILIIDSSTDSTPEIALAGGAEVLRVPKRGLGRAYIDAIPFIRGEWIVMGDADLTYDFRELVPFVEKFRAGAEFVMGSRFRGTIEEGAMPPLHRYFGTPFTTWILNVIYRSHFSDIHCGMRGLTRTALHRIDLQSQSWEYASEMVLKAARLGLKIEEVPVKFYKDREGRMSHHRRAGWLSPWIAGWINLKVMLVYSPDSFLLKPGVLLFAAGLLLAAFLAAGPRTVAGIGLNLHFMLFGMTCATLGYSCIQIGVLARNLHCLRPGFAGPLQRWLTYDRGMIVSGVLTFIGLILSGVLVVRYLAGGLKLSEISYPSIFGLLLIILGFQTFCFTLLIEMTQRLSATRRP